MFGSCLACEGSPWGIDPGPAGQALSDQIALVLELAGIRITMDEFVKIAAPILTEVGQRDLLDRFK